MRPGIKRGVRGNAKNFAAVAPRRPPSEHGEPVLIGFKLVQEFLPGVQEFLRFGGWIQGALSSVVSSVPGGEMSNRCSL